MDAQQALSAPEEQSKLEQLYTLHRHAMLHAANGILRDPHLAQDAVQEAFLRIAKNLSKISQADSPQARAFAVVIVKNVCLTILNDLRRQTFTDNIDALSSSLGEDEEKMLTQLEYAQVVSAIKKLPDIHKDALLLYYVDGHKATQVAQLLGVSTEVAKKRIQRGRRRLLAALSWEKNSGNL